MTVPWVGVSRVATQKLDLCASRGRSHWNWLFSRLLFRQTLSYRDLAALFSRQASWEGGLLHQKAASHPQALSAKCSFRHSKNADDTLVSLCVENFLITKTEIDRAKSQAPKHS